MDKFLECLRLSQLVSSEQLDQVIENGPPGDLKGIISQLIREGMLTDYQVKQLLAGKHKGFFLGRYRILQPIGQGGMGLVFLAKHSDLDRKVAVKVLTKAKAKEQLDLERFFREARAAAALDHPNIVKLFDISQGSGIHYLVMEYVEGTDLQSLLGQTGPLHFAQAVQYVAQVAGGLQHAHEKGFLHRDIKPANLMLNKEGIVKILDMGLARRFSDEADNLTAQFKENEIVGSVDYLSPEQAMNHPLDERSDIYSLGATLFTLVTGHTPFTGTTHQKLMQHQFKEATDLVQKLQAKVPPILAEIITKMMAKRPSERIQSAIEVIEALSPWLPAASSGNILPLSASGFASNPASTIISRGGATSVNLPPVESPRTFPKKYLVGGAIGLGLLLVGILAFGPKSDEKQSPGVARVTPPNNEPKPSGANPVAPNPETAKLANISRPSVDLLPPPTRTFYTLDFASLQPFTDRGIAKVENGKKGWFSTSKTGEGSLPPGWTGHPYRLEDVVEYFAESIDGQMVLGSRGISGDGTAMLFLPETDFSKGRWQVRIEYRTELGSTKKVLVRMRQGAAQPYKLVDLTHLDPTAGEWVQETVNFEIRDTTTGRLELHHYSSDLNSDFRIRAISVLCSE